MEKEECPICLQEIEKNNKITTSCKHDFCKSCLDLVLKNGDKCPLCREKLNNTSGVKKNNDPFGLLRAYGNFNY
jgi:hypothetical protein